MTSTRRIIGASLAEAVTSHVEIRAAVEQFAAVLASTAASWEKLAAVLGKDGVAELRAAARRFHRYERHCHPARQRRPYRHGRVGVR